MLNNMKIGTRLYIMLGFLSILLIGVGWFGMYAERATDDNLETIYNDHLMPAMLLSEINGLQLSSIQQLLLAQFNDPKQPASKLHEMDAPITMHIDVVEANSAKLDKLWEQYMATKLTPEEKKLTDSYVSHMERYRNEGLKPVVSLLKAEKFDEAGIFTINKVVPLYNESEQDLKKLIQIYVDVAKDVKDRADIKYAFNRNLLISSVVAGVLLALGTGFLFIRSISGRLAGSVSAISTSATEIAATMAEHERTVGEQSAAVTEVTATAEELGVSSQTSAQQSENTAALANQSLALTEEGIKLADRAYSGITAMKDKVGAVAVQILRLSEQAEQIGSIAKVVGELASETNMLALNAAVEAARAGEHGKGFAVVASEIRKLADQSKKSAERTNGLVEEVQKATNSAVMATEEGTKTAEEVAANAKQSGESFAALAEVANQVYEGAQQVMLNSKQQSGALTQVSEAMKNLSNGSKEIATATAQARIGVLNLNEVAQSLKAMV